MSDKANLQSVLSACSKEDAIEMATYELSDQNPTPNTELLNAVQQSLTSDLQLPELRMLKDMMYSGNEKQMEWAIGTLQEAKIDVVALVSPELKDSTDGPKLNRAIQVLEKIKDLKAIGPLFGFLGDLSGHCQRNEEEIKNPMALVRLMAATAKAIGNIGVTPTQLQLLTNRLTFRERHIRIWINEILGRVGNETTVPVLVEQISNEKEDPCIRISAARALIGLKSQEAAPELFCALLSCKDETTAIFLATKLAQIIDKSKASGCLLDLRLRLTSAVDQLQGPVDHEMGVKRLELLASMKNKPKRGAHAVLPRLKA